MFQTVLRLVREAVTTMLVAMRRRTKTGQVLSVTPCPVSICVYWKLKSHAVSSGRAFPPLKHAGTDALMFETIITLLLF